MVSAWGAEHVVGSHSPSCSLPPERLDENCSPFNLSPFYVRVLGRLRERTHCEDGFWGLDINDVLSNTRTGGGFRGWGLGIGGLGVWGLGFGGMGFWV